jgi:hypothetical protein
MLRILLDDSVLYAEEYNPSNRPDVRATDIVRVLTAGFVSPIPWSLSRPFARRPLQTGQTYFPSNVPDQSPDRSYQTRPSLIVS